MTEAELEKAIKLGKVCSACHRPFVGAHGRPVLCPPCHIEASGKARGPDVPKAWHELEET